MAGVIEYVNKLGEIKYQPVNNEGEGAVRVLGTGQYGRNFKFVRPYRHGSEREKYNCPVLFKSKRKALKMAKAEDRLNKTLSDQKEMAELSKFTISEGKN